MYWTTRNLIELKLLEKLIALCFAQWTLSCIYESEQKMLALERRFLKWKKALKAHFSSPMLIKFLKLIREKDIWADQSFLDEKTISAWLHSMNSYLSASYARIVLSLRLKVILSNEFSNSKTALCLKYCSLRVSVLFYARQKVEGRTFPFHEN